MIHISEADYFAGYKDDPTINSGHRDNARLLLIRVNALLDAAVEDGVDLVMNPHTNTLVSGSGNGGWRPQTCPIGAPLSAHKLGRAVDVQDARDDLDAWLTGNDQILEDFMLYREAPHSTLGWVHLSDRAPPSGKHTFEA